MPVLDGNMDEYSDARSLAASIKGGRRNNDNLDDFLNDIVDTIRPDSSLKDLEGASLPELIQGGAKGHSKEPKSGFHQGQGISGRDSSTSFQPIGINIAAPPTPLGMVPTPSLLMPGYYGGKTKKNSLECCSTNLNASIASIKWIPYCTLSILCLYKFLKFQFCPV